MKVSILILAYNHEKFIAQAVESSLKQITNFNFEIVIGDDYSYDSTRKILMELKSRYPDHIRLIFHNSNIGMLSNFASTLNACRGEYIALLDGDDYWISKHKLLKQVNFLETHLDCAFCYHPTKIVGLDGNFLSEYPPKRYRKRLSDLIDILKCNFISTSSTMFRRGLFGQLPNWFFSLKMGDWSLHVLNSQHGRIGYLDETMSAYRVHERSNWSKSETNLKIQNTVNAYVVFNEHLNYQYDRLIRAQIALLHKDLQVAHFPEKKTQPTNIWTLYDSVACLTDKSFTASDKLHLFVKLYTPFYIIKFSRKFKPPQYV